MRESLELELKMVRFWSSLKPVIFLKEYCHKNLNVKGPLYYKINPSLTDIVEFPNCDFNPRPNFTVCCRMYNNKFNVFQHFGYGMTIKEAKQNAASKILYLLTLKDPNLENIAITHEVEDQSN